MSPYATRAPIAILVALTAVSLTIAMPLPAAAQVTTLEVKSAAALSTQADWTPANLANAKPMPLPRVSVDVSKHGQLSAPPSSTLHGAGRAPSVSILPDYNNVLFPPRVSGTLGQHAPSIMPNMFGANPGYRFTSSRLTQDAVAALGARRSTRTPSTGSCSSRYRPEERCRQGRYVCSATVQRPRIITTARTLCQRRKRSLSSRTGPSCRHCGMASGRSGHGMRRTWS